MSYQILEHTADLAIKGYGQNLAELFSNLAEGMYGAMAPNLGPKTKDLRPKTEDQRSKIQDPRSGSRERIRVEGDSAEELLVNWLNELLFLTATKHQIYYNFQFDTISERELNVVAEVIPLTQAAVEIKAATWHDLKIEKIADHLEATVVFDI